MSSESSDNLPVNPDDLKARDGDGRALYVENLHYHPTNLTELRRLAEVDPKLAATVVEAQREGVRLMDRSFRLALAVTSALALTILLGVLYLLVKLGWWQTGVFIFAMLGVGHLLRVILTGEWSDTSWVGRFLSRKAGD